MSARAAADLQTLSAVPAEYVAQGFFGQRTPTPGASKVFLHVCISLLIARFGGRAPGGGVATPGGVVVGGSEGRSER